ncbi:lasso RiPP family leader peptide-containing protein [Chloroflexota bacterium]
MKNAKQIQAKKMKQDKKEKQPFVEPKLEFIEPKLVKHGDVKDITAGFFGSFYP